MLFLLLNCTIFGGAYSRTSVGKTETDERLIKLIQLYYFSFDIKFSTIIERVEPIYHEDRLRALELYMVGSSANPFTGERYEYLVLKPDHFVITNFSGIDAKGGVEGSGKKGTFWFRQLRSDYEESADGKTITLNIWGYESINKYMVKNTIVGTFNDSGLLLRAEGKSLAGKGTDHTKVKFVNEYKSFETLIEREPNETNISYKQYEAVFGKNITTNLIANRNFSFSRNGMQLTKRVDNEISFYKFSNGKLTEAYEDNQIKYFEYDNIGFLKLIIQHKADSDHNALEKTLETAFDYELVDQKLPMLWSSYRFNKLVTEFNSSGVAVKQYKNKLVRAKNPNGEWGEWMQTRY